MCAKDCRVSGLYRSYGYSASLFLTVWGRNNCADGHPVLQEEGHPHSKSQQLRAELPAALLINFVFPLFTYLHWSAHRVVLYVASHSVWDHFCPLYLLCSGENNSGVNGLQGYTSRK